MTKAGDRSTTRRRTTKAAETGHVRVRMYNVGFGDCFLLRLPTSDGERRVLIDCGYHSKGKGEFTDRELVEQIQKDLAGEALDVVVATHRHQDHISGFGERDLWDGIAVEEVWLPFTADPNAEGEEPALREWRSLMEAAHGLFVNNNLSPDAVKALGARSTDERSAAEFMLWNARTNKPGIDNLLDGMRRADGRPAKRRFLPEEKNKYPSRVTSARLPGVVVHVLGPHRDPAFRRNRKVPSTWGFTNGAMASGNAAAPFRPDWYLGRDRLPGRLPLGPGSIDAIRLFNDDLFFAAKALDGFLNGESIVLVLEVGKARLLFTGDAEVGTWTAIMETQEAADLAAGATFLKVGHHGSHNATPLVFVRDRLSRGTPAAISTQEGDDSYRHGIPFGDLLTELDHRQMPYARSDQRPRAGRVFTPSQDGRWVDCIIPC